MNETAGLYAMYVYKTTLRFISARKYKLIKLLTFIWVLTFIKYLGATQNQLWGLFCQSDNTFFNIHRQLPRQLPRLT